MEQTGCMWEDRLSPGWLLGCRVVYTIGVGAFAAQGSTEGKTDYLGLFFFFFSDMQERVEMTKPLNLGREIL